jgi:outer membrane protein
MRKRPQIKGFLTVWALLSALSLGWTAGPESSGEPLSLTRAIELAIRNNLTSKLAKADSEAARGQAIQAAASLLPQITGSVQQSRVFKVNLEAQGFPANGGFNPLLGPFNTFDARFNLVQKLLDFSAIWRRAVGKTGEKIADLEEQVARDQVATAAVLAYFEAQRTRRSVVAAEADLKLSESLRKLARDQHAAGIATGVDVARAETNYAQFDLRRIRAEAVAANSDVRLKRLLGLAMNQPVVLPDIPRAALTDPVIDQALGEARAQRAEVRLTQAVVEQARYSAKAARAEYIPALAAKGDYGFSGNTPSETARTGSIGGQLQVPIFAGGTTHGRVVEAEAREREADDRMTDTQMQIEEDVRLSAQTLIAAAEETRVAEKALELARKELAMARDRYQAGVGDNIQLLTSQTSVARAADDQVNAFAHLDTARANLAAAMGAIQQFK